MAEQPELDLPMPAAPPRTDPAPRLRRAVFAGFTRAQILAGLVVMAAAVWGMWVTKALIVPKHDRIVSARLSSLVGDYVQAQARSASPPAQVEAEMRRFMASLDTELQRRSAEGQIILVGEAVLTKSVPDITETLRQAVYASGAAPPRPASQAALHQLEQQAMIAAQSPAAKPAPTVLATDQFDPTAMGAMPQSMAPAATPQRSSPAQAAPTVGGPGAGGK